MLGRFILRSSSDERTYFVLSASSHSVVLRSESYPHKSKAFHAIETARVSAPNDRCYERRRAGKQWEFILRAANGDVIGISERYASKDAMEDGIDCVKRTAPWAAVRDLPS